KQVPSSFIEQKSFCISWHYRKSPRDFAEQQALKLNEELENGLSQFPARLMHGKKIIEVCAMEANKGVFLHWFLDRHPQFTHGFSIGDDRTDEDVFAELQNTPFATVKVGPGQTLAKYRLSAQTGVFSLLQCLENRLSQTKVI
ncbi:MAG: trehalose-phosphatase, partial [Coxiella sp. (in: Bacteria)]